MRHYQTIEQVEREALRAQNREPYRLPDSWWSPKAAEAISSWIKRRRSET